MASLMHGHELGQTLGDGEGQGGLESCCPWGHKESYMTAWLNNSNKNNSRQQKIQGLEGDK